MLDSYFAIIVQNSNKDSNFSDMLLDCFACGVVPIYYGSRGYAKIFDDDGVMEFKNTCELTKILSTLSKDDYATRLKSIKHNFEKVANLYYIDEVMVNEIEKNLMIKDLYK